MYLDALLELVAGRGRAFPEQLAEDDDLLEEEHAPLFGPRQHAGILLCDEEGLLLQQLALAGQLALRTDRSNAQRAAQAIIIEHSTGGTV